MGKQKPKEKEHVPPKKESIIDKLKFMQKAQMEKTKEKGNGKGKDNSKEALLPSTPDIKHSKTQREDLPMFFQRVQIAVKNVSTPPR